MDAESWVYSLFEPDDPDELKMNLYPPQTVFVGWYTVFTLSVLPTVCVCVRVCVRVCVSVTFCFLNNLMNL